MVSSPAKNTPRHGNTGDQKGCRNPDYRVGLTIPRISIKSLEVTKANFKKILTLQARRTCNLRV